MRFQTLAEARWILGVLALCAAVSCFFSTGLALFFGLLILGTLLFFRDPDRVVPGSQNDVVAAADGVVTEIREVEENEFLKSKAQKRT